MKKALTHVIPALVMVLISASANATFLSSDWKNPGDNLITRDTVTGLEWLDWQHTTSRTYNDVSSKLGVGGEFEGFRYATLSDIETLYANFGFVYPTFGDPANIAGAELLTSLFGITFGTAPPENGGTEALYERAGPSDLFVTAVNHRGGLVFPEWFGINAVTAASFIGHALIRNERAVPEPASLALLGLGLAGFSYSRRKAR